jgi:hypothetical protein
LKKDLNNQTFFSKVLLFVNVWVTAPLVREGSLYWISKRMSLRLLGPGSKQEIALVTLVSRSLTGTPYLPGV